MLVFNFKLLIIRIFFYKSLYLQLLKELLNQQNETDSKVNRLQQEKLVEKNKLINDLLLDEEKSQLAVYKLISLKNEPDPLLLEKEQEEQERILDQVNIIDRLSFTYLYFNLKIQILCFSYAFNKVI